MKTNKYIKPVTKYLLTDSDQLLASMSTHEGLGGQQLSKEWFESSEQEESLPKQPNVWDE